MSERRTRPPVRGRRFDLRATAMFFALLAAALVAAGLAVRALAGVVQRRPVWGVVLLCVAAALVLAHGRRRRRPSAAGIARRTGEALEQATTTALDALDAPAPSAVQDPAAPYGGDALPATAAPGVPDYDALGPEEFEEAIAALCVRDGCSDVRVVGGAGDLGADVVALSPEGRRLVIQCKRYGEDNKVGSQDLQRFGGTCFTVHEADLALVVTTSDFTAPAREYAEQCGITCVDRGGLLAWSAGPARRPWAAGAGGAEA